MEEEVFVIDNLEVHKKDNFVIVSVNPKLYPLEVIYSAAYIFIDRTYVMVDGDPKEEILVQLNPKNSVDVETLGREFNNELINYMVYMTRTIRSQNIREAMVQRALATNSQQTEAKPQPELSTEDLEKIAKPWKLKE